MRMAKYFFIVGAFALLTSGLTSAQAQTPVSVTLANLGTQSEPGSGTALVDLKAGTVNLSLSGLKAVPHDNPVESGRVLGYAAWLANSEDALSKLKLGVLIPSAGIVQFSFQAPGGIPAGSSAALFFGSGADLSSFGFNQVLITLETAQDLQSPQQPSGPPIASGAIPGTAPVVTPPPAVEVLMGYLNNDVFGFWPITVTIFSGQSIRWTNVSPEYISPHTATRAEGSDSPAFASKLDFDSGSVVFGKSFTRTFTLPAGVAADIYSYHCTPHQVLGMTGRIVVVAQPAAFTATLTGAQEVPPVTTSASGSATFTLNPTANTLTYNVTTTGIVNPILVLGSAGHIHEAPAGANGNIVFVLEGSPPSFSGKTAALTSAQVTTLFAGGFYVNVHTAANPGGEIRGQILSK